MCRERSISEINAPGLLSDICVKIYRFDEHVSCAPKYVFRKRQRPCTLPSKRTLYAILVDGPKQIDMILLHHCYAFKNDIEKAHQSQLSLKISRLLSQQEESNLVLVPTADTTIVFPSDCELNVNASFESPTQSSQFSPTTGQHSQYKVSSQVIQKQEVVLSITDIFIIKKQVSLASKIFRLLPNELAEVLVDTSESRSTYQRAIITLMSSNDAVESRIYMKVTAGSTILMKLCGNVDPKSLVRSDSVYKELVSNLLLGLVEEKVELKWFLEKSCYDDKWNAKDVKLVKF